jgi:uncharacterized SAM-binding protein YcdF (DUF218 family)
MRAHLGSRPKTFLIMLAALSIAIVLGHGAVLSSAGRFMSKADSFTAADWCFVTPESGRGGELEAADLFSAKRVRHIVVLLPAPSRADQELLRRGFTQVHPLKDRLAFLGIPVDGLSFIAVADGGTNESAAEIAKWIAQKKTGSAVVIVGPTHVRRFRRVLAREWPAELSAPAIISTTFSQFDPQQWWRSRTMLREGIIELEKLLLEYLTHPLG